MINIIFLNYLQVIKNNCKIYVDLEFHKDEMKNQLNKLYGRKVKKMFEVTYSMEGIIRKIMINASDAVQAQNIFTNMYGSGKVQIINIRRV